MNKQNRKRTLRGIEILSNNYLFLLYLKNLLYAFIICLLEGNENR